MSEIKTFEVTRLGRRADITLDELEGLYKFTNEQLTAYRSYVGQILKQIQTDGSKGLAPNTSLLSFEYQVSSHGVQHLKQAGKASVYCHTLNHGYGYSHPSSQDLCNQANCTLVEGVDRIQQYNDGFMQRARAGYIRKDKDRFFYLTDKFDPNNVQSLNIEYIVNSTPKATCEKCGVSVERNRLKAHQKTSGCAEGARLKAIKDRGLVPTYIKDVIKLAERGLIPSESVPTQFQWYVPARIHQSVEQYSKSNGYAGLTLEEYLLKMHGTPPEEDTN